MPIKPENKDRYPSNWKQISKDAIERAGNKCQFCDVENHATGYRDEEGEFHPVKGMALEALALDGVKTIMIVLTVAHMDHTPENCDPSNLKALCQKCHLNYDAPHRAKTRAETKRKKEQEAGQTFLFGDQ